MAGPLPLLTTDGPNGFDLTAPSLTSVSFLVSGAFQKGLKSRFRLLEVPSSLQPSHLGWHLYSTPAASIGGTGRSSEAR